MTEQLKPPFHVKAIAPYTASSATELSLTVGLELEVLGTDGRGVWWQAQKPDGSGIAWFPASYVQVVESQPSTPALPPPPVVTSAKTSQLNLAASVSNDANLSAPQSARSLTGSGSGKEKKKKSSASSTNGKKKKKSGTKKKKAAQERPPEPSKPLRAEKGTTPCSVKIQLVSAELKAEVSKEVPSPAAFLYMREVLGDKDGRKAFATAKLKKTLEPNWNEAFQLDVTDAESEIVAVRVCSGDKPTSSKGKYYGEVTFPLRGAVRDFDSPSYQYKWCDLLLDNKEVGGRIRVFIQYIDTRVTSAPTNFKHESHVGWTADGGFDISNIPGDWKELFKSIGLTKHDLQENSSLAKEVFEIMNNANALPLPPDPIDPALLPAPLPLPVTSSIADLPLPPPPMPGPVLGAPTPMPLAGGAAPPPPPPPPPAPANNNGTAPPPPPQPSGNVSSSGPRSSFLDDVKKGAVLRPVAREQAATPNAPGGDVTSVLKLAMERHRKAMAEMPEPSGGGDGDWSDWSEDDDEDEDQGDE